MNNVLPNIGEQQDRTHATVTKTQQDTNRRRRPHVGPVIRSWVGDPRGSWNGDVLVVDSTNVTDLGDRFDENLHLAERFSRIDSETLLYEFTVDDPATWTKKWSASIPMVKSDELMFEYACHEANYALEGVLKGARYQEKQPQSQK